MHALHTCACSERWLFRIDPNVLFRLRCASFQVLAPGFIRFVLFSFSGRFGISDRFRSTNPIAV